MSMRRVWAILALVAGAGTLAVVPAAQAAEQAASSSPPACTGGATHPLGVSRVLEIDTTGGPRFGLQQYKENDILRDHEVILTFDDGPLRPHTKPVLDALAAHCTRATFFMVGQQAAADPEMVREVARRGHTIASHTLSHKNLRAIGASKAQVEIERGIAAVQKALGSPIAPFFRFPYLSDSQAMMAHLRQRNIAAFSIDVDSVDYRAKDPATELRNVMVQLVQTKKGIILFHDIQKTTALGVRNVLDQLAAKGFKFVHVVPKAPLAEAAVVATKGGGEPQATGPAATTVVKVAGPVSFSLPAGVPVDRFSQVAGLRPSTPGEHETAAAQPNPSAVAPSGSEAKPSASGLRGSADYDDWRRRVFSQ